MRNKHNTDEFHELARYLTRVELHDEAAKDRIYNRLTYKLETGKIRADQGKKG
ncbi:hypothetical protein [Brevibacillus agri]|uniref:hypothetical protein n=1 Tax=Brevibacillus agri TaxID=51101 RepID=UPI0024BFE0CF|nr:hypothetical protein [Brevibacillus agri]WHX30138.1 hypothetical protein QNK09_24290 [Brevibacillus agri]